MTDSPSLAYVKLAAFSRELEAIRCGAIDDVPEQVISYLNTRVLELKKIID